MPQSKKPELVTIAAAQQSYADSIFTSITPHPVQQLETKKAFLAGYFAAITAFYNIGAEEISYEEAEQFVRDRHLEAHKLLEEYLLEQREIELQDQLSRGVSSGKNNP